MSEDCKGRRISIGPCDIRNSHKITADGVLQNVLECEICGRREVQTFDELYKKEENIKLNDHKQTKYYLESEYKSILLNSLEQLVKLSKKNNHKIR